MTKTEPVPSNQNESVLHAGMPEPPRPMVVWVLEVAMLPRSPEEGLGNGVGYGRDWWECLAVGALPEDLSPEKAETREVRIFDDPEEGDVDSRRICEAVCTWWVEESDLPGKYKKGLAAFIADRKYASAFDYLHEFVYDHDWTCEEE